MIAVDFGLKRMGIAKYEGGVVLALPPIIRKNRNQASSELKQILDKNNAKKLIIGLNEDEGLKERILHFLDLVKFEGEIIFINEDFTSVEALDLLAHTKYKKRQKSRKDGTIDSLSASIILNRYLEKLKFAKVDPRALQKIETPRNRLDDFKNSPHKPVLLNEVMDSFKDIHEGIIIDATFGLGGMSECILKEKQNVKIIAIDRDKQALKPVERLQEIYKDRIIFINKDFNTALKEILSSNYLNALDSKITGLLADIGVSSMHLDDINRGFSFKSSNLDMRMDQEQILDAKYILNHYPKMQLEDIFKNYGEIREYKKLTSLIIHAREKREIDSEILQNIAKQIYSKSSINHSTLIYQALRIEVNDELAQLRGLLDSIEGSRKILSGATIALISFHSLEDRIIKEYFKKWSKNCLCSESTLKCDCGGANALGETLYKKPLTATTQEISFNNRSRSAKLRAFKLK